MESLKYDPKIHYDMICDWALERGMNKPPLSGLPHTGRIVPGKCALFLYLTNSSVGFLESMIANPTVEKHEIPEAIDLCVKSIEKDAKIFGVRYLIGHFYLPVVGEHCDRLGFKVHSESYKLLSKELEKG